MNLHRLLIAGAAPFASILFLCWPSAASAQDPAPREPHQLRNIAARAQVQLGDRVLIGGFIINGEGPKRVLIRGIGPSLRVGGAPIAGRLNDPTLELHGGENGQLIASNNDWTETQQQEIAGTDLAPADTREAAILRTLNPGAYTAVMRGRNGDTGMGLVEVYDVSDVAEPKLANLSARAFVGTGDNVLIGGLIVDRGEDDALLRVVVRALGPSLSDHGVPTPLQDPMLELYNANGTLIMSNDNAADDNLIELQQTGLMPPHASESALLVQLPRGGYTAIVKGKNSTTGIGLVEVFDAPRNRPL